jgi:uncharacterized lipoprotein YajG
MKPNTILKLVAVFMALTTPGCGTMRVKLAYISPPGLKSPLSTIKPMTIELHVHDLRDAGERDRQADVKNGYGMTTGTVVSDKDVTLVLFDAIKSEFENSGHKIVSEDGGNADAKMDVELNRFWSESKERFWDFEMLGTISTVVTIGNTHRPSEQFSKRIVSTSRTGEVITGGSGQHEAVLNAALKEYIKDLTYDPGVLKALDTQSQSP